MTNSVQQTAEWNLTKFCKGWAWVFIGLACLDALYWLVSVYHLHYLRDMGEGAKAAALHATIFVPLFILLSLICTYLTPPYSRTKAGRLFWWTLIGSFFVSVLALCNYEFIILQFRGSMM